MPSHPSYHPIPTLQLQAPPELPQQHLGMNMHCNTIVPTKLRIWQQNARKSQTAQHYILNTDPLLYDLILLQEPWIDSYGNTRGNHHWRIVYPSNRHTDGHGTIRSVILINTNISTDAYATLSIPHSDITAIQLKGELGHCSIFNIYKDCTNNSTTNALHTYLNNNLASILPLPTDHMLWFGNFNRHHPLWEEDKNHRLFSPPHLIDPLIDTIQEFNMILALPLGIPTYESAAGNWARPNNMWRSNNPTNLIISCDTKPSM